jgi:hypothetical protein
VSKLIPNYEYDIAISFAGENRGTAEQLATIPKNNDVTVFYDNWEIADLWGKDLYEHLDDLYRRKARYCIIFISEAYARKAWTRHELKSAQARAFRENQEYILPVRLDDTELPGIRETVGFLDLRSLTVSQLADITLAKLKRRPVTSDPLNTPPGPSFRIPRIPLSTGGFSDDPSQLLRHLERSLDRRFAALANTGLTIDKQAIDPGIVYRVTQGQRLLFYLSMRISSEFGSRATLAFQHGWNEPSNPSGMTAVAAIETSHDQARPLAKVTNFSLLDQAGSTGSMSFDELAEGI